MSQSEKPPRISSLKNIKHKIINFSQSVGLSPQRMLLSVILLTGVGGLIYFIGFSSSGDADTLTREEILREQDNVDQQLQQLLERQASKSGNFLVLIERIQEAESEVADLEASHTLTPTQKETIARIRLKGKSFALLQMMNNKLSYDAEKADLFRFCEIHKNAAGPQIRDESRYWLCAIPTIEFAVAPTEETLKSFSTAIQREDSYLTSLRQAAALEEILTAIKIEPGETSKLAATGIRTISQRMRGSDVEAVRSIGERLVLLEVFGQYKLETLGARITWKDPSAPADEDGAITALSNNIQVVPASVWEVIINAYESHLSHGDVEKVGVAWQRMWALSEQVASEDTKTQVQTKLRRQKRRAMMIGTTLDISGTGLRDGKPLDFGNYEYVAIIFFDEGDSTLKLRNTVIDANERNQPSFYSVIALDEEPTQAHIKRLKTWAAAAVVDDETSQKYRKQLLVESIPYIVLVDRSGKILNSQLEFDQIENRVARLKSNRSTGAVATP